MSRSGSNWKKRNTAIDGKPLSAVTVPEHAGASAGTRDNTDMGVEISNSAAFSCESRGYLFEQVDEDEFDIYSDENVYFPSRKSFAQYYPTTCPSSLSNLLLQPWKENRVYCP